MVRATSRLVPWAARRPLEETEGRAQEQRADQQDPPDQRRRQDRRSGPSRRAPHDAVLLRLEGEHEAEEHGGRHVDPEDLDRQDRQRGAQEHGGQDDQSLAQVRRQGPGDELGEVVEDAATLLDRGLDGGEVVVGQDHVGGVLGHVGPGDPHGDADIRLLERGRVVHAVAGHRDHVAARLERLHEAQLLLGRHAREHVGVVGRGDELGVLQRRHLGAGQGPGRSPSSPPAPSSRPIRRAMAAAVSRGRR